MLHGSSVRCRGDRPVARTFISVAHTFVSVAGTATTRHNPNNSMQMIRHDHVIALQLLLVSNSILRPIISHPRQVFGVIGLLGQISHQIIQIDDAGDGNGMGALDLLHCR